MFLLRKLDRRTEIEALWLLGRFGLVNTLFRFWDIHPSPDSGWQVEAQRLYRLAFEPSVQYSTSV